MRKKILDPKFFIKTNSRISYKELCKKNQRNEILKDKIISLKRIVNVKLINLIKENIQDDVFKNKINYRKD